MKNILKPPPSHLLLKIVKSRVRSYLHWASPSKRKNQFSHLGNLRKKKALQTNMAMENSNHFEDVSQSLPLKMVIFHHHVSFQGGTPTMKSGQIIIFHQPRFPWNKGISLTKPPFGVRSCEVAIIWPDEMTWHFQELEFLMDPRCQRLSDQQCPMVSAQHGPADWDMDHLSWIRRVCFWFRLFP